MSSITNQQQVSAKVPAITREAVKNLGGHIITHLSKAAVKVTQLSEKVVIFMKGFAKAFKNLGPFMKSHSIEAVMTIRSAPHHISTFTTEKVAPFMKKAVNFLNVFNRAKAEKSDLSESAEKSDLSESTENADLHSTGRELSYAGHEVTS